MKEFMHNLMGDEQGQDLVEYSLLLGGVVLLALAGIDALGGAISGIFTNTAGEVTKRGS